VAKTSPRKYECSYEYGEANRYSDGTATTTVYKGGLTFELNSRILSGSTRFSIDVRQNGLPIATYSEEAEWAGKRQTDREDCATAQESFELLKSRAEAGEDKIQRLNTRVTGDEVSSPANAGDEERHRCKRETSAPSRVSARRVDTRPQ